MLDQIMRILLDPVLERIEVIMATVEELNSKLDSLKVSLDEAKGRITEDVEALRSLLADRVDPTALDELSTKLDSISATVQGIDPDPDNPPEEPTPTP